METGLITGIGMGGDQAGSKQNVHLGVFGAAGQEAATGGQTAEVVSATSLLLGRRFTANAAGEQQQVHANTTPSHSTPVAKETLWSAIRSVSKPEKPSSPSSGKPKSRESLGEPPETPARKHETLAERFLRTGPAQPVQRCGLA